jgi:hypothetical protein
MVRWLRAAAHGFQMDLALVPSVLASVSTCPRGNYPACDFLVTLQCVPSNLYQDPSPALSLIYMAYIDRSRFLLQVIRGRTCSQVLAASLASHLLVYI